MERGEYRMTRIILTSLDILLALLIILGSFTPKIIGTPLGKYSLAFGFAMILFTTSLKILHKW